MIVDGFLRTFFDKFVPIGGYAEVTVRPWNFPVAEGIISGSTPLTLTALAPDGGVEPLWGPNVSYSWPTADQQPWLVSSDADDDAAPATGANTVRVTWLNAAGVEATEDIELNGVAAVQMVAATVRRINRVEVLTCGSLGINDGNITVYQTDAATRMAYMAARYGVTDSCIQTVPSGKIDVLTYISGHSNSGASGNVAFVVMARESGGAFYARGALWGRFGHRYDCPYPVVLPAGTDYYVMAPSSNNPVRTVVSGWRETA